MLSGRIQVLKYCQFNLDIQEMLGRKLILSVLGILEKICEN